MVRFLYLPVLMVMASCGDRFADPIELPAHGEAFRHNMHAQIINPVPPAPRPPVSSAARAVVGIDAYRRGEVKDPLDGPTVPDTIDTEGVN